MALTYRSHVSLRSHTTKKILNKFNLTMTAIKNREMSQPLWGNVSQLTFKVLINILYLLYGVDHSEILQNPHFWLHVENGPIRRLRF